MKHDTNPVTTFIVLFGPDDVVVPWLTFLHVLSQQRLMAGERVVLATHLHHLQLASSLMPGAGLRPLSRELAELSPSAASLRDAFRGLITEQPSMVVVLDGGAGALIDHVAVSFRRSRLLHFAIADADGRFPNSTQTNSTVIVGGLADERLVAEQCGIDVWTEHGYLALSSGDLRGNLSIQRFKAAAQFELPTQSYWLFGFDETQFDTCNGLATVAAIADLAADGVRMLVVLTAQPQAMRERLNGRARDLARYVDTQPGSLDLISLIENSSGLFTNRADLAHLAALMRKPALSLWAGRAWRRNLPHAGVAVGIRAPLSFDGATATALIAKDTVVGAFERLQAAPTEHIVIEDTVTDTASMMEYLCALRDRQRAAPSQTPQILPSTFPNGLIRLA